MGNTQGPRLGCKGTIYERFERLVAVANEPHPILGTPCWEWVGSRMWQGYGNFSRLGRSSCMRAHRASWELHVGPVPDGLFVLHRCDNRGCVAPHHLFLGTAADNTADMMSKGRDGLSKMTDDEKREALCKLAAGESALEVAAMYGVSRSLMYKLKNKRVSLRLHSV